MKHILLLLLLLPSLVQGEEIVINAVGDIMLSGSARDTYRRKGYDYAFATTAALLKEGDIAIGNLEAPLTDAGTEFRDKRFRFRVAPVAAAALKGAGFSVLTLANNHILDYGADGLADTLRHLDREGILHTGAGIDLAAARQEAVVTVKGKKVAVLSYSNTYPAEFYAGSDRPGTAPGYSVFFVPDITRVRSLADYVIVCFHWGAEMATLPKPYQMATARRAIDAGADVVIGHHPHVLQGAEQYGKGVILYSLGNFAFGSRSPGTATSAIARVTLGDHLPEVELIPLRVLNRDVRFQPKPLSGQAARDVADHFSRISEGMGTSVVTVAGRHFLKFQRETIEVATETGREEGRDASTIRGDRSAARRESGVGDHQP